LGGKAAAHEEFTVEQGTVTQKVIVTGKTKAVSTADLAFQGNGRVASVAVRVGASVVPGQVLAVLDQASEQANVLQAEATLASETARLEEIRKGTRPEEIALAETTVANAKTALMDAENNFKAKATDAYNKSDDAVRNNIDSLFDNARTANPQINLPLLNPQAKNDLNLGRAKVEIELTAWSKSAGSISQSDLANAYANLSLIQDFADKVASAINSQTANTSLTQATLDGYKAAVSAARTNISATRAALTAAEEKMNGAKSTLASAEQTLALKKAGNTVEAIRAQEAKVLQAEAGLATARVQLSRMTLRSPIAGTVTKVDTHPGETVSSATTVISVISGGDLEIESNVSEISIGKVALGNPVEITMDAFPGKTFKGTVAYIEPAETIVDGVVNYKVTITPTEKYPELRSGLTTNLDIITAVKENVLRIPQYGVIKKDGQSFVSKQQGKIFVEVPVTVGLIGQDGFAEITSGLTAGDVVDVAVKAE
jgi:RND family efflux transporter MFP subunit